MASATCLVVSAPVAGCRTTLDWQNLTKCKVRRLHSCNVATSALQNYPPLLSSVSDSPLALLQSLVVQSRSLGKSAPCPKQQAPICCSGGEHGTSPRSEPRIGEANPGRREAATDTARLPDNVAHKRFFEEDKGVGLHRRLVSVSLAAISSLFATGLATATAVASSEGDPKTSQGVAATSKGSKKANVFELKGGVKALDVRIGTGPIPQEGDKIAIHYYGRLGAKQGWRFDSSYEHKDLFGVPEPYIFTVGSGQVISGIDTAVRSMRVGGIRRVVIPPDQGYQNKEQGPVPPDFFDRQRLYTTIFNPTRLANGEGATLGTVIFDLELVRIQT